MRDDRLAVGSVLAMMPRDADAVLDVRRLCVTYETASGEVLRPLRDVSLTVGAGELVAVYGPSGSGKTTLLKVIVRVRDADSGTVLVGGADIGQLADRELDAYRREEVGFIPQSPRLIAGLNVAENAALALTGRGIRWREAIDQVTPLLERLELGRQLARMPNELSEGERQRVAIASALSTEPLLVLADEPTGRLDPARARAVRELLAEVCRERGVATLMTTHDPDAMSVATRAWLLHDGTLVEHAPPQAVR